MYPKGEGAHVLREEPSNSIDIFPGVFVSGVIIRSDVLLCVDVDGVSKLPKWGGFEKRKACIASGLEVLNGPIVLRALPTATNSAISLASKQGAR